MSGLQEDSSSSKSTDSYVTHTGQYAVETLIASRPGALKTVCSYTIPSAGPIPPKRLRPRKKAGGLTRNMARRLSGKRARSRLPTTHVHPNSLRWAFPRWTMFIKPSTPGDGFNTARTTRCVSHPTLRGALKAAVSKICPGTLQYSLLDCDQEVKVQVSSAGIAAFRVFRLGHRKNRSWI